QAPMVRELRKRRWRRLKVFAVLVIALSLLILIPSIVAWLSASSSPLERILPTIYWAGIPAAVASAFLLFRWTITSPWDPNRGYPNMLEPVIGAPLATLAPVLTAAPASVNQLASASSAATPSGYVLPPRPKRPAT